MQAQKSTLSFCVVLLRAGAGSGGFNSIWMGSTEKSTNFVVDIELYHLCHYHHFPDKIKIRILVGLLLHNMDKIIVSAQQTYIDL